MRRTTPALALTTLLITTLFPGTDLQAASPIRTAKTAGDARALRVPAPVDRTMSLRMTIAGKRRVAPVRLLEPLTEKVDVVSYQNGDDPVLRKRPGRLHTGPLIVAVPRLSKNHPLMTRWQSTREGQPERTTIELAWVDGAGKTVQQIVLYQCWPSAMSMQPSGEWFITIEYEESAYEF